MAKKAKAKPPVIYPDSVRPPQPLPDAASVRDMEFDLSDDELTTVRTAMAIHAASKKPTLTWTGWHAIALALAIGSKHAKKASGGKTDTPNYIRPYSEFLRKSGLAFLNHNDRAAALRLLPYWHEVDDWRGSLTPHERQRLNNPREVEREYAEYHRKLGNPDFTARPPKRRRKEANTLLDDYVALKAQVGWLTEQRDQAERQAEYFAELADTVAKQAKFDDDDMAEIRAKLRSLHDEEEEDEPD